MERKSFSNKFSRHRKVWNQTVHGIMLSLNCFPVVRPGVNIQGIMQVEQSYERLQVGFGTCKLVFQ